MGTDCVPASQLILTSKSHVELLSWPILDHVLGSFGVSRDAFSKKHGSNHLLQSKQHQALG